MEELSTETFHDNRPNQNNQLVDTGTIIISEDGEGPTGFHKLPPEMVTAVLEYLEASPESLLACRLVCSQFKLLIDDILEKLQLSLWSWSKSTGESKPFSSPGPIKRPSPHIKLFQDASDISKFVGGMTAHAENGFNPFPNRSIYIRRVRSNPSQPPPLSFKRADDEGGDARMDGGDHSLHEIRMRSFCFFELGHPRSQSSDNPDSYLLSIPKILQLLEKFGTHLTSLILECGVTVELESVRELGSILERCPNLQNLMLKGIRIDKRTGTELQNDCDQLPVLEHLKSLKVIQSVGIAQSLLKAYHDQLQSLQLINHRDYWFPHFEKLQRKNDGNVFGKLKELKLGEFENPSEFDYLYLFLRLPIEHQLQNRQQFPKLERLSLHYNMFEDFVKPTQKIFQVLEQLPKLKEYNVGNCPGTTFTFEKDEEKLVSKLGWSPGLVKISLPVQFLKMPWLIRKMLKNYSNLKEIRFLDVDKLLWEKDVVPEQVLGLTPEGVKLETVLKELVQVDEFPNIFRISVVTCFGDEERVVSEALKMKKITAN